MKCQISPQYLREEKIYITIIEVKSPIHYVIKESPSIDTASTYASNFLELEESLQKYYRSLEKTFFQLPVKDTVLIVERDKKYYRAKVCSILNLPRSYLIKVYLLDYGKECSVPKSCLYEMHPDFMSIPFQVIDFKLPGLEPMSLVMNSQDLSVEYGTATDWDPSASIYIEGIRKALRSAYVKVEGVTKNCICGTLHVTFQDEEEKCVNDELVFKKFAAQNPEYWNDITRLVEILSKENLESSHDIIQSQSHNQEVPMSFCNIPKSLPATELSSSESLSTMKSPVTSGIVTELSQNVQKSGVAKLREILKAKKALEQSKLSPQEKKESLSQSHTEGKSLRQKDLTREFEGSKSELLEDVKNDHYTTNKDGFQWKGNLSIGEEAASSNAGTNILKNQNEEYLSVSKEAVLKTVEDNNCDQNVSVSSSASTFQKFKEMVARKRAAQNKQNISQTLSDNSCFNSLSQTEMDSLTSNTPIELERSKQFLEDLNISATQIKSVGNDFSPTSKKLVKAELIAKSLTMQEAVIAEGIPTIKSDKEQSQESRVSSEQEVVSKKVDPKKISAFFQRNKKARALFLAQNKQDQVDANSQLIATSSALKPHETETQFVTSSSKFVEASQSLENKAGSVVNNCRIFMEEPCVDNSAKLELADESSKSHKDMESLKSAEQKEIAKPKIEPGKLKNLFEQNRKDRALFLAQTGTKQDKDNKSQQSDIAAPSSETDLSAKTLETKRMDIEYKNDPDILDLVNESSDSNSNR